MSPEKSILERGDRLQELKRHDKMVARMNPADWHAGGQPDKKIDKLTDFSWN